MPGAKHFFSKEQKEQIVAAIREAELNTSGEIRVHLEERAGADTYKRAIEVFEELEMHLTLQKNGVLFYLAVKDHKFSIIGDYGINNIVGENFWQEVKELMQGYFKEQKFTEGLCEGIKLAGEKLKAYFPYRKDDANELPDDLSFNS